MGHLVNPISFRLGYTQKWRSQWYASTSKNYINKLKDDFLLYNFIESFFKYAKLLKRTENAVIKRKKTRVHFNSKYKKNKKKKLKSVRLRPSQRKKIRIRRYAFNQFINKFSLTFSHSNILRVGTSVNVNIHLYDGAIETRNAKYLRSLDFVLQKFSTAQYRFNLLSTFNSFRKNNFKKKNYNYNYNLNENKFFNFSNFFYKMKKRRTIKSNLSSIFFKNIGLLLNKKQLIIPKFTLNGYQSKKRLNLMKLYKKTKSNFIFQKQIFNKSILKLLNKISPIYLNFNLLMLKKNKNRNKKLKLFKIIKCLWLLYITNNSKLLLKKSFLLRSLLYGCVILKNTMFKFIKKILISKKKHSEHYLSNIVIKKYKIKKKFKKTKIFTTLRIRKKSKGKISNELLKTNLKFTRKTHLLNKIEKLIENYKKLNKFLFYLINLNAQYTFDYSSKQFYKRRYNFWFYISRVLFENTKSVFKQNTVNLISFNYFGLTNLTPTASMLANYISKKISQKYTINEVLKPVSKDLLKNFAIQGFKFCCAGRLTKKQRASFIVQKEKKVPTNTFESVIDYATSTVKLRHGISGIKVWITRKKSYKYFEYNFNFAYKI